MFWLFYWIAVRFIHLLAIMLGIWQLHRKPRLDLHSLEQSIPSVSILKPICDSDDPFLFSNLETFFTLEYPGRFEIIFCLQDTSDKTLQLYINKLKDKYPNVKTQVFCGGEDVGMNPKINNMYPGYMAAKYELLLISDARIRMKKDTLMDMVCCMTQDVGLVHQMPFTCDQTGVPAVTLEKIQFGASNARMYLLANAVGINCAIGMSELIRKHILDESGGLKVFGKYLAEDYFFAQTVLDSGYKLGMATQPAWQNSGLVGVSILQDRVTRWNKLRMAMIPFTSLLEPATECILSGLLATWSVLTLFRWDPLAFFFIHLLQWFLLDWVLLLVVQNGELPFNKFEFLVMWMYREITAPYLYANAIAHPEIKWRTNSFRIKFGGIAEITRQVV